MKTTFKEFTNKAMKLKDILDYPSDIEDIFNICKNEIDLNADLSMKSFYERIYTCCLLEYHNLTFGNNFTNIIRDNIKKSDNFNESKRQYKKITNPNHIIPAILLHMIIDIKPLKFTKLEKYNVQDVIGNFVGFKFSGETRYSISFEKKLLNSEIDFL